MKITISQLVLAIYMLAYVILNYYAYIPWLLGYEEFMCPSSTVCDYSDKGFLRLCLSVFDSAILICIVIVFLADHGDKEINIPLPFNSNRMTAEEQADFNEWLNTRDKYNEYK